MPPGVTPRRRGVEFWVLRGCGGCGGGCLGLILLGLAWIFVLPIVLTAVAGVANCPPSDFPGLPGSSKDQATFNPFDGTCSARWVIQSSGEAGSTTPGPYQVEDFYKLPHRGWNLVSEGDDNNGTKSMLLRNSDGKRTATVSIFFASMGSSTTAYSAVFTSR